MKPGNDFALWLVKLAEMAYAAIDEANDVEMKRLLRAIKTRVTVLPDGSFTCTVGLVAPAT